jgi:hypothetical protein
MLKEERTRKTAAYSRYRIRFLARSPFSRALDFKGSSDVFSPTCLRIMLYAKP